MARKENDEKLTFTLAVSSPVNELSNPTKPQPTKAAKETAAEPELPNTMMEAMNLAFRAAGPMRIRSSL